MSQKLVLGAALILSLASSPALARTESARVMAVAPNNVTLQVPHRVCVDMPPEEGAKHPRQLTAQEQAEADYRTIKRWSQVGAVVGVVGGIAYAAHYNKGEDAMAVLSVLGGLVAGHTAGNAVGRVSVEKPIAWFGEEANPKTNVARAPVKVPEPPKPRQSCQTTYEAVTQQQGFLVQLRVAGQDLLVASPKALEEGADVLLTANPDGTFTLH